MGYSTDEAMVRVDFFKESGKWYTTEAVRWTGAYDDGLIHHEFMQSLRDHLGEQPRLVGMRAVCLEPCHQHQHPLMVEVPRVWPDYTVPRSWPEYARAKAASGSAGEEGG